MYCVPRTSKSGDLEVRVMYTCAYVFMYVCMYVCMYVSLNQLNPAKRCRCCERQELKLEDGEASHTLGGAGEGGYHFAYGEALVSVETFIKRLKQPPEKNDERPPRICNF
jgi:hypothetical protein